MNEEMKLAWLEISDMLGEPTREELDVFLRTWQRASQATRKALAEQQAQRTWVGLTDEERFKVAEQTGCMSADWLDVVKATETALQIKNQ